MMSFPVCPGTDDSKDADSLLDETVANSNQNNSNCSSPSHMSDSVSLTTDSSQDNSLCTPERETKIPLIPKNRYTHTYTHTPLLLLLLLIISTTTHYQEFMTRTK